MGNHLAFFILGLISMSHLWEGVQCNRLDFNAPRTVWVQKGLCVTIPCNFTYGLHPAFINTNTLYGYWYEGGKTRKDDPAFATNDGDKRIVPGAHGRFRLSEKLEEGDCSLFISDAQESDRRNYVFRIEKGEKGKWSFPRVTVTVTETPTPEIRIPGKLRAGQPVKMTCTAASCPLKSPQISWEFARNISGVLLPNGINMSSLVSTFVPTAADYNQPLTCRVTYGSGSDSPVISSKRISLNVEYPPQKLQFSGILKSKTGTERTLKGLSHIEAQEGDHLSLICEAEGNPLPNLTWVHRSQTNAQQPEPSSQVHASLQLTVPNMMQQDMGGYTCRAQNTENSSERTFQVYMAYSPKVCSQSNTSCWKEDDGVRCNCSVCSYPGPQIQWVVDGKTVEGNASNNEMKVTSQYKADKATSILHLKGTWDGHHSVMCRGNSSNGEASMNFLLLNFKEDSLKQNLTSGAVGALIMFVIAVIIILIVVIPKNKKCQRTSKSVTDSELCTDRSVLVFGGSSSNVKGSDISTPPNQEESKNVPKEPEKPEKSSDDNYADPQELYYATIQFSGLKPVPAVTSEKDTTEYAEIKTP